MSLPNVNNSELYDALAKLELDKPVKLFLDKGLKSVYDVSGDLLNLKYQNFSSSAAGHATIMTVKPGFKYKIYGVAVVVEDAVDIRFYDRLGSSNVYLAGDFCFGGEGHGWSEAVTPPAYLWETRCNCYVSHWASGAVKRGGCMWYWEVECS